MWQTTSQPCAWVSSTNSSAWIQLDELTARRQLKSPWSLSGRSLHLTLVPKWSRSDMTLKIQISRSWPRSNPLSNLRPRVQIDMFAFLLVAIGPLLVEIQQISYLTLKIEGQGQGQIWWLHLRPRVQSMCSLFILWQSDHFWLRYSQFDIWPWKFKVKVTTNIAQNLIS